MASSVTTEPLLLVVRTYYGFSQVELAQLLGVSRGLVALVETGRRALPLDAEARLSQLSRGLPAPTVPPADTPAPPDSAAWEPLQRHQRKCLRQARGLRQELEKLQTRAAQYQRRLAEFPALYRLFAEVPAQAGLKQLEMQARYGLTDCGAAAQALLRVRIQALEFEAAEAERQLRAGPLE